MSIKSASSDNIREKSIFMLFYLFDSFFKINHVKKNSCNNSCDLFYHTILHTTIKTDYFLKGLLIVYY